jgi:DNA-binding transcriptional regulator YiaG
MAIITIVTPEEFKGLREAAGLTQAALAGMVGVHQVTIARWETEMRRIPEMGARLLTLIVEQKRSGKKKPPRSKSTNQSTRKTTR